jgi:hypothetical protein
MTIKDHSENDWGFFVEMDYPSFDKIKRENHFKKIYWKILLLLKCKLVMLN